MSASLPLASGRDADVYPLGDGRGLRRYRRGGDVRDEAAVMTYLHRLGYPVPEVYQADGPDLVMRRLTGPTLAAAAATGSIDVRSAGQILADLLQRLHALPARRSIDPADRILHLDLHPENVMLTPDGPVVVDWRNSAEGPPGLDLAVTALIVGEVATDPAHDLTGPARGLLGAYLAEVGPLDLLAEAVVVRARLGPYGADRVAEAAALVRAGATG
ncbi:serine/threonine protein kinase [Micromonospora sp. S4605]|uniref:phosphotransferase n=1 Tax=Micromonospora sp. S4605 TaxID=1420897 RepID=UPI000D6F484B|nr:phosphotransferase [Micromonospora sp. S4605]PWU52839.1 serine/threonine protein kinase [Micromonospora sp. S4605]